MKKKLPSLIVLMFLLSTPVFAEETLERVEPNVYEKKAIEIGNQIRNRAEQKDVLPEEQHHLTFEKSSKSENNQLKDDLFQSTTHEKNTITAKADQLHLFSKEDKEIRKQRVEEQVDHPSTIPVLMGMIVILVIVAMFVLIIPRLKQMPH